MLPILNSNISGGAGRSTFVPSAIVQEIATVLRDENKYSDEGEGIPRVTDKRARVL